MFINKFGLEYNDNTEYMINNVPCFTVRVEHVNITLSLFQIGEDMFYTFY